VRGAEAAARAAVNAWQRSDKRVDTEIASETNSGIDA
jgi:hypothetical protein